MQEPPQFGSEYAKSDRSVCKLCKAQISQGSLRLAIFVQSPFFDGKMPNWYHFGCLFKKATPTNVAYIKGFDALRWDDQQKIKDKMNSSGSSSSTATKSNSVKQEDNQDNTSKVDQYLIEYSKSNRAKCVKCDARIEKSVLRVQIKGRGKTDGWYHLDCFEGDRLELGFTFKPEEMNGFDELEKSDQLEVNKKLAQQSSFGKSLKRKASDSKVKTEKNDAEDVPEVKKIKSEQEEKEEQLRLQSQEFWKLRDMIDKELANDVIKELINHNKQKLTKFGRDDILTFLCDAMYFGPLSPCPDCGGQLIFRGKAYACSGDLTEWTKCAYRTQEPKRNGPFSIPQDLKDHIDFLKDFVFQPHTRVFEHTLAANSVAAEQQFKLRFANLNFATTGKLTRKAADIKRAVERLGGSMMTSVNESIVALISSADEVAKMSKKIKDAQTHDVHVVSEEFLDKADSTKDTTIEALVVAHSVASWGGPIQDRIDKSLRSHEIKHSKSEARFLPTNNGDTKVKLKLKGGAVVDPDTELEDEAHVLCEKSTNEPYSCVLGMVDITQGTNSYYKLQILQDDKNDKKLYLFRAWGRVGTTIGRNKLDNYSNVNTVAGEFEHVYYEKTGNSWSERKSAVKKPNRFYPLEMDYGGDDEDDAKGLASAVESSQVGSKLAKPVQDLVRLIFDIESMKRQMKEFEIDLNKMPLGKISANQIKMAYSILTELDDMIAKNAVSNPAKLVDASNRFYTLIPHDFGMKKPTILDNSKLIKDKTDMLNNLLEIEIAYNLLKTSDNSSGQDEHPIDLHYKRLRCDMQVVERTCDEFAFVSAYLANTHAATHADYKLQIEEILRVERDGEAANFNKSSIHNRHLLWHGSRLTNFAGILSQGLRIAPPEAPKTGYMFGKGVYFADMVSKSANYCFANSANTTGLLLLCEVALGDMHELSRSEFISKLPDGKHSCKGLGRTAPDPKETVTKEDGLLVPMGKSTPSGVANTSLLYNEYIVYDTSQIKLRYLLRVNFQFKY